MVINNHVDVRCSGAPSNFKFARKSTGELTETSATIPFHSIGYQTTQDVSNNENKSKNEYFPNSCQKEPVMTPISENVSKYRSSKPYRH